MFIWVFHFKKIEFFLIKFYLKNSERFTIFNSLWVLRILKILLYYRKIVKNLMLKKQKVKMFLIVQKYLICSVSILIFAISYDWLVYCATRSCVL